MKKIHYLFILFSALYITSCDLYEEPKASVSKDAIMSSEAGLQTYVYSFYEKQFPSGSDASQIEINLVDFGAINNLPDFQIKNAYSETNSSGWSWSNLRNINYFIENCTSETVDEKIRNHYIGLARFFRAYFYYDMVRRFGDVPWIDKTLDVEDEELYAPRDSRELVMEKVYEDLEFACENITLLSDASGSMVTKWVAYAFASRVALFEGTFRKYHNLSLSTSADTWLQRAADKAEYVMTNSGKKLYTAAGTNKSYRALFTSDDPVTEEVLLAVCSSSELGVLHHANWKWTSPTYGNRFSMTRTFINTYLQTDGTPYTSRTGWETELFYEECQNRDARLAQTIRTPGYTREGTATAPDFMGYSRTGYQPLKLCLDDKKYDDASLNTNAIPLFRYAEVLLNYAEAKAELGKLTDEDWSKTIGALRSRAGITGGISAKPTVVDSYFQQTYFPSISDPTLLEIRRERAIELCLEGFRFDDIRRWKCGYLLNMSWDGMHIKKLNEAIDLDRDGTYDVLFYDTNANLEAAKAQLDWSVVGKTCATIQIQGDNILQRVEEVEKGNPAAGYYITWDTPNDYKRVFGEKQYLYPIPSLVMVKNPNITQNKGWENGASNDGN
ncbi:RagB/SusD family nutrient uptake outer membrane protein [Massilibacteroides sp.]|uniref:RagB/SusD family nutrient uptake outer membrane protein n=1 Tax=Massilibacteroides sp. TaxID=2034766 RepID=UPI002611401E|nr:RagB/SusD family nutrient uptake outer membrane protein [Massilibacteroides sp.]MDD4514338.1 RagB/SusD family nutrient uptake outer membrane protein [Massilibacteroides sp.]